MCISHTNGPKATAPMIVLTWSLALVKSLGGSAPSDAPLLAALRTDALVRACTCVVAAAWVNESYPRVTIDEARWRRIPPAERTHLAKRALAIAERVYLMEFAAVDQYERVFLVDRRGKALLAFGSG